MKRFFIYGVSGWGLEIMWAGIGSRKIHRNLSDIKRTMPVDVLAARSSRLAKMSALPTMERRIVREGVVLYEQDELAPSLDNVKRKN